MPKSKNRGISDDLAAKFRVYGKKTTWNRDMGAFSFKWTDELLPLDHFTGQDRAQEAIRFGLEGDKPGYNLFVTGLTGTGKTSAIQAHLQNIVDDLDRQEKRRPINDWTYVYNFEDADRPRAVRLPRGTGKVYRQQLSAVLRTLQEEIPKVLISEGFEAQVRSREETDRKATQDLVSEWERAGQAQLRSANDALRNHHLSHDRGPAHDSGGIPGAGAETGHRQGPGSVDAANSRYHGQDP